jgi:hypothetical protein
MKFFLRKLCPDTSKTPESSNPITQGYPRNTKLDIPAKSAPPNPEESLPLFHSGKIP